MRDRLLRTFRISTFYNSHLEAGCLDNHCPSLFSSQVTAKTGENYLSGSTADADPRPCLRAGANETGIIATISWQLDFLFFFFQSI